MADDFEWTGGAGSNNWNDPQNWFDQTNPNNRAAPAVGDTATISTAQIDDAGMADTIYVDQSLTVQGTVTAGAFALGIQGTDANVEVLGGGTIDTTDLVLEGANSTLTLDAGSTLDASGGQNDFPENGDIGLSLDGTVTIDDATVDSSGGWIAFGENGDADVEISDGATLTSTYGEVGSFAGSQSTVLITGEDTTWTMDGDGRGDLSVGSGGDPGPPGGDGDLTIADGATVTNTNGFLGTFDNGYGLVTVTGEGTTWTNTGYLDVGESGGGEVDVDDGATVAIGAEVDQEETAALLIGFYADSTGAFTLTDDGTTVSVNGQAVVGLDGDGTLAVDDGASLTTGDATGGTANGFDIGFDQDGTGFAAVEGHGSTLTNTGSFYVGVSGDGTLVVTDGATLTTSLDDTLTDDNSGFDVAVFEGSTGDVEVSGDGSSISTSSVDLTSDGDATVLVSDGASFTDSGDFTLEPDDDGTVDFTVTGQDSELMVAGEVVLGGTGEVTLSILDQAKLDPTELIIGADAADDGDGEVDPATGFNLDHVDTLFVGQDAEVDADSLTVGQDGNGALVTDGGSVTIDGDTTLGENETGQGQIRLDGDGASMTLHGSITVGASGAGLVAIGGGNDLSSDGDATLGEEDGSRAFVTVGDGTGTDDTSGASWEIGGDLTVGGGGTAQLAEDDGSVTVSGDTTIGEEDGGSGTIAVNGGTFDTGESDITVGKAGNGALLVQLGGTLTSSKLTLGEETGGSGTVSVSGANSMATISELDLGESGSGDLTVDQSGTLLINDTADIAGVTSSNVQSLSLDTDGVMSVTHDLTIGEFGVATVTVKGGAQLAGDSGVTLAESGGSSTVVTISGADTATPAKASGLGYGGTLEIGEAGVATLNVQNGGLVASIPNGTGVVEIASDMGSTGTLNVDGAGSQFQATTLDIGGTDQKAGGLGIVNVGTGGTVTLTGAAHLWSNADIDLSGGSFTARTTTIDLGALLEGDGTVDGAVVDNGAIATVTGRLLIGGDLSGAGSALVGPGGTLEIGGAETGVGLQFTGNGGTLQIDDAAGLDGTVSGFDKNDTLLLHGIVATSAALVDGTLEVYDGGADPVAAIKLAGDYSDDTFNVRQAANGTDSQITVSVNQTHPTPLSLTVGNTVTTAGPRAVSLAGSVQVTDTASDSVTLEIESETGSLSATAMDGGTVTTLATTAVLLSGTVDQVNADIASLTYSARAVGSDRILVDAYDGSGESAAGQFTVDVLDQPPTLTLPHATIVTALSPTAIGGISVSASLSAYAVFTVDLSDKSGALTLSHQGASTVAGSGTDSVQITGDLADVDADLATLVYTGASTGLASSVKDTIDVAVSDGAGGQVNGSVGVTVDQALDQAPFVKAPKSVAELTGLAGLIPVSLEVFDPVAKTFTVSVADTNGTLSATAAGASHITGNASNALTITGSLSDVNADLATLSYTGSAPGFGNYGHDSITVTATDNFGKTGTASVAVAVGDPDTFYWLNPVNGSFSDATKWTPAGGPPDVGSIAVFTPGTYTVSGSGVAGVVDVTADLTIAGSITALGRSDEALALDIDQGGSANVQTGGELESDEAAAVGETGTGTLTISGGSVTLSGAASSLTLGDQGTGTATLTGNGASLSTDGELVVANAGIGTLNVGPNSFVTSGEMVAAGGSAAVVGALDMANGTVKVAGDDATWTVDQNLTIADAGRGTVVVSAGGTMNVDGQSLIIGNQADSSGSLTVTDGGSSLNAADANVVVGGAGGGSLDILTAGSATLGSLTVGASTGIGGVELFDYTDPSKGMVVNGALTIGTNGTFEQYGGVLSVGSLALSGDGSFLDNPDQAFSVSGQVTMDGGSLTYYGATPFTSQPIKLLGDMNAVTTTAIQDFDFAGADTTLATDTVDAIGTLYGFVRGDVLDMVSAVYGSTDSVTLQGNELTVMAPTFEGEDPETFTIQLDPAIDYSNASAVLASDGHGGVAVQLTGTLGQSFVWTGNATGVFDDATNWSPDGGPPGLEQIAIFEGGTATATGDGAVGSLEIQGTDTFTGAIDAEGVSGSTSAVQIDNGGAATFNDGGSLNVTGNLTLGDNGSGSLTVDGQDDGLIVSGLVDIGESDVGSLTISGSTTSTLGPSTASTSADLVIGDTASGNGTLTVTGFASVLIETGMTVVGSTGTGTVQIDDGASLLSGSDQPGTDVVAQNAESTGTVTIDGYGSSWTSDGSLAIALGGYGRVTVQNSGMLEVDGDGLLIGGQAGSDGKLTVTGAGSQLSAIDADVDLGGANSVFDVQDGATAEVGSIVIGPYAGPGTTGVVQVNVSDDNDLGTSLTVNGAISIGDPDSAPGTDSLNIYGGSISADEFDINQNGELFLAEDQSFSGSVVMDGGTFDEYGSVSDQNDVNIAGGTNLIVTTGLDHLDFATGHKPSTVIFDDPTNTYGTNLGDIVNFVAGDTLDLTGVQYSDAASASIRESTNVLTIDTGTASYNLQFDLTSFFGGDYFHLQNDGSGGTDVSFNTTPPCYVTGTRITTARGEVAVEDLVVGDLARTASGQLRAIVWLGRRTLDLTRHTNPDAVMPVRIAAGAFDAQRPARDLWVSPRHAIFADGVLVPAGSLVNGTTVAQVPRASVTYWHVELASHDILLAEGLPAESYLDCGNRTNFASSGDIIEMHPDFEPSHRADSCVPWKEYGPEVAAVKARLLARAETMSHGAARNTKAA